MPKKRKQIKTGDSEKNIPKSPRSRREGILTWVLMGTSLLLISIFSLHTVVDTDIWWHLKTGESILKEGRLVTEDIFSYTAMDQSGVGIELWLLPQWLSQVILYLIYSLSKISGLVIFKTFVLVASFAILYLIGYPRGNPILLIGSLLFAVITSNNWFSLRPYIFSLLFLTLDFYILERFRIGKKSPIFLLPFIQILWANMHSGHMVGMVLVSCYLIGEWLRGFSLRAFRGFVVMDLAETSPGGRKRYWRLLVFGGLSLIAGLVSFKTPQVLLLLSGLLKAEGSERPFSMIGEWVSPFSPKMQYLELTFYKGMIILSAIAFILNRRNLNLTLLLVWIAFLFLSVTAHRNILFFAPLSSLILFYNFSDFAKEMEIKWSKTKGWRRFSRRRVALKIAIQLLLILFCLGWIPKLVSNSYYIQENRPQRFGLGISEVSFPEKAIDFILKKKIPGNIFNNYDIGGYFLWRLYPEKKSFIDGRITDPSFLTYYGRILSDPSLFDEVTLRYKINCALLSHTSPETLGLIKRLYKDEAWNLIYLDEIAAIFIRDTPENQEIISQSPPNFLFIQEISERTPGIGKDSRGEFRALISILFPQKVKYPFSNLGKGRIFLNLELYREAEMEVKEAIQENPDLAYSHFLLGRIYLWSGRESKAIQEYRSALEIDPRLAKAHDDLGIIYASQGKPELAIREFKKAIRSGSGEEGPHFNLGVLYMRMNRFDDAKEEFKKTLRINPRHGQAHGNLGEIYLSKGLWDKAIEEYRLVLKETPTYLIAYLSLAGAYASKGFYEEAIEECKKALLINPNFSEAYYAIGDLQMSKIVSGRHLSPSLRRRLVEEAIHSYEQFLEYWTGDPKKKDTARENIGRLLKMAEEDE